MATYLYVVQLNPDLRDIDETRQAISDIPGVTKVSAANDDAGIIEVNVEADRSIRNAIDAIFGAKVE